MSISFTRRPASDGGAGIRTTGVVQASSTPKTCLAPAVPDVINFSPHLASRNYIYALHDAKHGGYRVRATVPYRPAGPVACLW